jgi:hypothetical protein
LPSGASGLAAVSFLDDLVVSFQLNIRFAAQVSQGR